MDPELLEKAIIDRKKQTGKYPKAIVPVALYGIPYHIDKILAIADKYRIPVVEDANEIMWYATQARDAYPYYQHRYIVGCIKDAITR